MKDQMYVPLEVVMYFPEKTHKIKGYLMQMDVNGGQVVEPTTFVLKGAIADWSEDRFGRPATAARRIEAGGTFRGADRSARSRRRARSKAQHRATASTSVHGDGHA